ncbi:maltose ABC transporter permease MalG [Niveibacterium umoris]|uniref:Maltose/maltodextrin transport system permease protein MalG n=1 Tax=Niveibacterium umoris TaxID=1193620 RepID=A0A840BN96_9RHOO|nr:ABC transporter permease subunit [Niveibacterium umoris]MBB4014044.1 maltose/maltodextrin transport system permease protein [Niveibacterium umoris]
MPMVTGRHTRWRRHVAHIGIILSLVVVLYPFANMLWQAVTAYPEAGSASHWPRFTTEHLRLMIGMRDQIDEYGRRVAGRVEFWLWMWNSLKVAATTTLLATALALTTGYAFARLRFSGRATLDNLLYMSHFFPGILLGIAYWSIFDRIGDSFPAIGLDTHGGLVLALTGQATLGMVWAFKGYFQQLPLEIEEAARIDGASDWQTFRLIALPLARPMIVVMALLLTTSMMYEPVLSSALLTASENATLPLGLRVFFFATDGAGDSAVALHEFAAGALLASLPGVIVFILAQRWMEQSTTGAIKG